MKRALLQTVPFSRALRRIVKTHPQILADIEATLGRLSDDAFDPQLRSHKLKGELADRWSCSVGYDLRILFRFIKHQGGEAIALLTIGTHDEVY